MSLAPLRYLEGAATAIFPAGGVTGEHLVALLAATKMSPCLPSMRKTDASKPARPRRVQRRIPVSFCYARRHADDDEFRQLEEQYWKLNPGQSWLSAAAFRPALRSRTTQLISAAQKQGISAALLIAL